jgi:RNA polymerase sigma-70 factor (ECF subfamily)
MGGVQEDAEDALSRAMLKAWDKLPGYAATITDLRAWLARLISNLCVDIHRERRRRTRSTVSLEEMVAADKEPAPPCQRSPEDALLSRELLGHVMTVVDELPARLREPFVLRVLQETPYREIAERLTLTGDNTRKRVQQARAIVRECLRCYLARPEAMLGVSAARSSNGGTARATSLQSTHLVE